MGQDAAAVSSNGRDKSFPREGASTNVLCGQGRGLDCMHPAPVLEGSRLTSIAGSILHSVACGQMKVSEPLGAKGSMDCSGEKKGWAEAVDNFVSKGLRDE